MLRAIDSNLRRSLEVRAARDPQGVVVDVFRRLLLRQALAPMFEGSGLWSEQGGLFGELWLDAIVERMPSFTDPVTPELDAERDGWVK